ncbi:MAG TPA: peptidoglycan editing factor PgeF [Chromatiaceae bacterium]|jgi:YfiH family protein|nr:peptidoglycan editing factor PgeF [Chromatiaceae bacterium]
MPDSWLPADWPVAEHIVAGTSLRSGGASLPPYDSFNLADHVGDDPQAVCRNRERFTSLLMLPTQPVWLCQQHTTTVVDLSHADPPSIADASVSSAADRVCVVLTADCLPLLMCDQRGTVVAAAHAGWRGLVNGVIEKTVSAMKVDGQDILVWLGPAIGPQAFAVGNDVREIFVAHSEEAEQAFVSCQPDKWHADLYALARQRLHACGVTQVFGGDQCTFGDASRFYSFRRDGTTGRMASVIWMRSP